MSNTDFPFGYNLAESAEGFLTTLAQWPREVFSEQEIQLIDSRLKESECLPPPQQ